MNRLMFRRLPWFSFASGLVLLVGLTGTALFAERISLSLAAVMGILPIAAAIIDVLRSIRGTPSPERWTSDASADPGKDLEPEIIEWMEQREQGLAERERKLADRSLAVQQWLQFPEAVDFESRDGEELLPSRVVSRPGDSPSNPLSKQDQALVQVVDAWTESLFDNIRQDVYRKRVEGTKRFDNERMRDDLLAMVSEVAAIYRPDDSNPLMRTNIEALSRAAGRASLRILVAVEALPGGLSEYDIQSIYQLISRAVQTYGMYQTAKPYVDVASNLFMAGRVISSTTPVTIVAWWAASKAASYGASALTKHVVDQQAVGLIRQLVEIVAVEVASLYSPLVRYRDAHWIYGVELVYLASELRVPESVRLAVLKEICGLQLRDEYGRVSLLRHAASGTLPKSMGYRTSDMLGPAERGAVAERLERFLVSRVLTQRTGRPSRSKIESWQSRASERLDVQFQHGQSVGDAALQRTHAICALYAFASEYLGWEPTEIHRHIEQTGTWKALSEETLADLQNALADQPPMMYQPPALEPGGTVCVAFLQDLIDLAAKGGRNLEAEAPDSKTSFEMGESVFLEPWEGLLALHSSVYYLRQDWEPLNRRFNAVQAEHLLQQLDQNRPQTISEPVARALVYLSREGEVRCLYENVQIQQEDQGNEEAQPSVVLVGVDDRLVVLSIGAAGDEETLNVQVRMNASRSEVTIEKVGNYLRSDCKIRCPSTGATFVLPGNTLRGYDATFAPLLLE